MMKFSVLSSGSRANCSFVEAGSTRILVDCGLSARETERRLRVHGISPDTLSAIVVSHEHSDHVRGLPVFVRKHKIPVYSNIDTFQVSRELAEIPDDLRFVFTSGQEFLVGDLCIDPFSVVHDAADPVAFRLTHRDRHLAIVTDLGHVTTLVRERIRNVDALVLESNHDPEMLRRCHYPWEVKQRIFGQSGHLSNDSAGELLSEFRSDTNRALRFLIAAHISENSNKPDLALRALQSGWGSGDEPQFFAADVYQPLPLLEL